MSPRLVLLQDGRASSTSVTEELAEDGSAAGKGAYADFKFVDRAELDTWVQSPRDQEAFSLTFADSVLPTWWARRRSNRTCTGTSCRSSCTLPRDSLRTHSRWTSTAPRWSRESWRPRRVAHSRQEGPAQGQQGARRAAAQSRRTRRSHRAQKGRQARCSRHR